MKRSEFLNKFLIVGAITAGGVPRLIKPEPPIQANPQNTKCLIDIRSIDGFTINGEKMSPSDIIQLYNQTGYLIYRSGGNIQPPRVINGELIAMEYVICTKDVNPTG